MNPRAFTLLEMVVASAVVILLAAIAFPVASAVSSRAKSAACLANLRQLGVAIQGYLGDHDMLMPTLLAGRRALSEPGPVIDEVFADYVDDPSVFFCPADESLGKRSGTSYFWNPALNNQRATSLNFLQIADTPSRIPVLSDKEGWHRHRDKKVNFLYADGHATSDLQMFTGE